MSPSERALIERYAAREGVAFGYFVRRAALDRALESLAADLISKRRAQIAEHVIGSNPFFAEID
jgi:hypothetical protein